MRIIMNPEIQARVDQYAQSLRVARRQAGDPSYIKLQKPTMYSKAQICRILTGKSFPRWDFVRSFLEFCQVNTAEISGRYYRQWLEISELLRPIGAEADTEDDRGSAPSSAPGPPGHECPECSALVTNLLRHRAWHATYVRRVSSPVALTRLRDEPAARRRAG